MVVSRVFIARYHKGNALRQGWPIETGPCQNSGFTNRIGASSATQARSPTSPIVREPTHRPSLSVTGTGHRAAERHRVVLQSPWYPLLAACLVEKDAAAGLVSHFCGAILLF